MVAIRQKTLDTAVEALQDGTVRQSLAYAFAGDGLRSYQLQNGLAGKDCRSGELTDACGAHYENKSGSRSYVIRDSPVCDQVPKRTIKYAICIAFLGCASAS